MKILLSIIFTLSFSYNIALGADFEKLLSRTKYLESTLDTLSPYYNEIFFCKSLDCVKEVQDRYRGQLSWETINLGSKNVLKELKEGLLAEIIKDLKIRIEKEPIDEALKEKLSQYEEEFNELKSQPYYD